MADSLERSTNEQASIRPHLPRPSTDGEGKADASVVADATPSAVGWHNLFALICLAIAVLLVCLHPSPWLYALTLATAALFGLAPRVRRVRGQFSARTPAGTAASAVEL